jgi:hypothetical protein
MYLTRSVYIELGVTEPVAEQDTDAEKKARSDWPRLFYQLAHSDIRWAKEQGWKVVNWALLLFGASLALYKFLLDTSLWVFAFLDAVIAVIAIVYLVDLHQFAAGNRETASRIQAQVPEIDGILSHRKWDRDHVVYLVVKISIVVISLVLTVLALRSVRV